MSGGLFVVLEGGEGCGKSTQAKLLVQKLAQQGVPSVLVHEPGSTSLGEKISGYLKDPRRGPLAPGAELCLFCAARAQLMSGVIKPALEAGKLIVCDRFTPSTVAYQGYGKGLDLGLIAKLNALVTGGVEPDLIVLLDQPAEAGLARLSARRDPFEAESPDFHRCVRDGYLQMARQEPERWRMVDARLPRGEIAGLIWAEVGPLMEKLHFPA
ncbi:MAG: dTMP kinase [Chloroflexota bacterium]